MNETDNFKQAIELIRQYTKQEESIEEEQAIISLETLFIDWVLSDIEYDESTSFLLTSYTGSKYESIANNHTLGPRVMLNCFIGDPQYPTILLLKSKELIYGYIKKSKINFRIPNDIIIMIEIFI
eukprot:467558_1